jgi:hypothetical protein
MKATTLFRVGLGISGVLLPMSFSLMAINIEDFSN